MALLDAAKINKIVISATDSFNTSGVFVILIFFFWADEIEILSYPTPTWEMIFNLLSIFSKKLTPKLSHPVEIIPSKLLTNLERSSSLIGMSVGFNWTSNS